MFSPSVAVVADAGAALGWSGTPVRVRLCGEEAWAIAALAGPGDADDCGYPVRVAGVLVAGTASRDPTPRASLFAGFCPRAVLVPERSRLLRIRLNAALLDQGIVTVAADDSTSVLSPAGPAVIVESPDGVGGPDQFDTSGGQGRARLLEQAYARLLGDSDR